MKKHYWAVKVDYRKGFYSYILDNRIFQTRQEARIFRKECFDKWAYMCQNRKEYPIVKLQEIK